MPEEGGLATPAHAHDDRDLLARDSEADIEEHLLTMIGTVQSPYRDEVGGRSGQVIHGGHPQLS